MKELLSSLPNDVIGFGLALGLSLLIGFEREELRTERGGSFFGGVRTFPLIALSGFLLETAFPASPVPVSVGLLVLGALLAVSHWASIEEDRMGITTEMAALVTYGLGVAASRGFYWLTVASGVLTVLLLQEKQRLERLAINVPRREIATLVRFLLLSAVILPIIPNRTFTRFQINPFTLWLVVVAVCGLSYLSYLLQVWLGGKQGALLVGLLGGAYSSTATTVVLARKSKGNGMAPRAAAGGIVAATGVMYIRLWILVLLFAPALAAHLTISFWATAAMCLAGSLMLVRTARRGDEEVTNEVPRVISNPLEITSAFTFAGLFLALLVITRLVAERFGGTGLLVLATVTGAADVDPFILGLTQVSGHGLASGTAALAVLVAAASNNVMKAVYARVFGARRTGLWGALGLVGAAALSIALFFAL